MTRRIKHERYKDKMIHAYLNYPNSRIEVHCDSSCNAIRKANKHHQRHISINMSSIGVELGRFESYYIFGSTRDNNDMWLIIDFEDKVFEIEVLKYVKRKLGARYKPFYDAEVNVHCERLTK